MEMIWWGWLIVAAVILLALMVAVAGVQARRRTGTVIAVQRGRRFGKGFGKGGGR
ncbi:hypothetical protein [Streptomyces syringium]|uniref:hypothetical protein n=2 Tax=Streptomyces syringium TaxID=76729 RepID=UPI0034547765